MMAFVLQRIGKPHEVTMEALADAAVNGSMTYGPYLRSARPEEVWTEEVKYAKQFASLMSAIECWRTLPSVRHKMRLFNIVPVRVSGD